MTDRVYCGATDCDAAAGGAGGSSAGEACADGEVCSAGSCTTSCPVGQIICDNRCITPVSDRDFCGATDCSDEATNGEACATGEVCGDGFCTTSCPAGQVVCNGACIDPQTDRRYCGATDCSDESTNGEVCADSKVCSEGACENSCADGHIVCNDTCIDPLSNNQFCGATDCSQPSGSGEQCSTEQSCQIGECRTFLFDWSSGIQISAEGVLLDDQQVLGTDMNGNTLVVWGQYLDRNDPGSLRFYSRRYLFATKTWTPPIQVDPAGTEPAKNPDLTVAPNGDAYLVWDTVGEIFGASYDSASNTWDTAIRIDDNSVADRYTPRAAIDENGNAWVAWTEDAGAAGVRVVRRYFDNASGTFPAAPEVVKDYGEATTDHSFSPVVRMSPSGDVVLIWVDEDPLDGWERRALFAAQKKANGAWSTPQALSPLEIFSGYGSPDLGVDDAGNAYVVWTGFDANTPPQPRSNIKMRKYDGSSWLATVDVTTSTDQRMRQPTIATGPLGNSVVAYFQGTYSTNKPDGPWPVYGARVTPDMDVSVSLLRTVPDPTPDDPPGPPYPDPVNLFPSAVLDGLGNAHITWASGSDAETAKYDANSGSWGSYETLASGTLGQVEGVEMSAAPGGRAFAIWIQAGKLFFARYD